MNSSSPPNPSTSLDDGRLPIGTSLANGKYVIEQYLASGGFGNTYVATDTAFDEKVAIKEHFLKGKCGRSPQTQMVDITLTENRRDFDASREKFRKEARRLRKLNNPHIVHVHNLFDENGTTYYVMDYIEGESLSERLKRTGKPLTEADVILLLPQLLDALECIHNEGLWHLDLKPANIMVDKRGNAVLIDFGASKHIRVGKEGDLTTSTAVAYTSGFAPTEQMESNLEKFGPWTDLYSLGATLYNLLTCQKPPLPSSILEDPVGSIHLPAATSHKTRELVMWLMRPSRNMRPQSVGDVKQFLMEENNHPTPKPASLTSSKQTDDGGDTQLIRKRDGKTEGTDTQRRKQPRTGGQEIQSVYDGEEKKPRRPWLKQAGIAAALALCGVVGYGVLSPSRTDKGGAADSLADSTILTDQTGAAMKSVTDLLITVKDGPKNMREYTFTGELSTAPGALPNGKGTAKFKKYGEIPSSTYKGRFTDGLCDDATGEATLSFTSGDHFKGSFKKGYYDRGTYTLSDGSHFTGSFKNGNPWDGKWYNADGSFWAQVKNGVER